MIDPELIKPSAVPLPDAAEVINPTPLSFGTHYRFPKAGLVLPAHTHTERLNHVSVVLAGSFKARVGEQVRRITHGDIIALPAQVPHSFEALEEQSVLLNVVRLNATVESALEEVDLVGARLGAVETRLGLILDGIVEMRAGG